MPSPRQRLERKSNGERPVKMVVRPPDIKLKTPPIKLPKIVVPPIVIPEIKVPPVDLGPVVRTLNGLIGAVSDLRGVVAGQQKMLDTLAANMSNLKVTTPPRPRTYEVDVDDGNGGTRTMRIRAGK